MSIRKAILPSVIALLVTIHAPPASADRLSYDPDALRSHIIEWNRQCKDGQATACTERERALALIKKETGMCPTSIETVWRSCEPHRMTPAEIASWQYSLRLQRYRDQLDNYRESTGQGGLVCGPRACWLTH